MSGVLCFRLQLMAAAVAGEYPKVWIRSNVLLLMSFFTERASMWLISALEILRNEVPASLRFRFLRRFDTTRSISTSSIVYCSRMFDSVLFEITSKSMPNFSLSRRYVRWARSPEPEYSGGYLLETTNTFNEMNLSAGSYWSRDSLLDYLRRLRKLDHVFVFAGYGDSMPIERVTCWSGIRRS